MYYYYASTFERAPSASIMMRTAACSLALLGAVANAALLPRNMISSRGIKGSFVASIDSEFIGSDAFVTATVQAMSAELGLSWERVQIDSTKAVGTTIARRLQASATDVEILYTVSCEFSR